MNIKKDDAAYKKYAQQAFDGFLKLIQQLPVNIESQPIEGIGWILSNFSQRLHYIQELANISDIKIPEVIQTQWEQLKTQAFERYKSEIPNSDVATITSLRGTIERQIASYFTPDQVHELQTLFNQRAEKLGEEKIVTSKEKEQKKLEDEQNRLEDEKRALLKKQELEKNLDRLKNKALNCYTQNKVDDYIRYDLKMAAIDKEQFDALKELAQSRVGNFDDWSKNISDSNYSEFTYNLQTACKKNIIDEATCKKYAQRALEEFIKLARQQTNIEHIDLIKIGDCLNNFFQLLSQIPQLAKIAYTKVPEEKELEALGEPLKAQAFKRYQTGIKDCDQNALRSLHWFIQVLSKRYFIPEKTRELKQLFNQRATQLGDKASIIQVE